MEASFPFFSFYPMMKLFPAHTGERANHEAMFSLLQATQDFSFWAQRSCCTSSVAAGQEGSGSRAESLNSGRFFLSLNSYVKLSF